MVRARDIMTRNPITIPTGAMIAEAVLLMSHLAMRHLIVVDGAGHLAGIVSDRDLRGPLPHGWRAAAPLDPTRPVGDVMTAQPITVTSDADLPAMARLMTDSAVGALPIVDETGALVGIVSYVDVLRRLAGDDADGDDALAAMDRDEIVEHPPTR